MLIRILALVFILLTSGCYSIESSIIQASNADRLPGGPGVFVAQGEKPGEEKIMTVHKPATGSQDYQVTSHGEDEEFNARLRFHRVSEGRYLVEVHTKEDDSYQVMVAQFINNGVTFFSPDEDKFKQLMQSNGISIVTGPPLFGNKTPFREKIAALKSAGKTYAVDQFGFSFYGSAPVIFHALKQLATQADISKGTDQLIMQRQR